MMANNQNLKSYKPGQSGNPNGRPKGARSMSTILNDLLGKNISLPKSPLTDFREAKGEAREVILMVLISKAIKGDLRAIETIMDRLEGKPKQQVDLSGDLNNNHLGDLSLNHNVELNKLPIEALDELLKVHNKYSNKAKTGKKK